MSLFEKSFTFFNISFGFLGSTHDYTPRCVSHASLQCVCLYTNLIHLDARSVYVTQIVSNEGELRRDNAQLELCGVGRVMDFQSPEKGC